jgi:hypothetical protein
MHGLDNYMVICVSVAFQFLSQPQMHSAHEYIKHLIQNIHTTQHAYRLSKDYFDIKTYKLSFKTEN